MQTQAMGDQCIASSWHHDKGETGGDARVRKQHLQRSWTSGWHQETWAGLPWWLSGKNICLPVQKTEVRSLAQGDPTPREIPHAVELLSPWATATEPVVQSPWATATAAHVPWTPQQWEACAPQLESSPCSRQLGKKPEQQWRTSTAKNKQIN